MEDTLCCFRWSGFLLRWWRFAKTVWVSWFWWEESWNQAQGLPISHQAPKGWSVCVPLLCCQHQNASSPTCDKQLQKSQSHHFTSIRKWWSDDNVNEWWCRMMKDTKLWYGRRTDDPRIDQRDVRWFCQGNQCLGLRGHLLHLAFDAPNICRESAFFLWE